MRLNLRRLLQHNMVNEVLLDQRMMDMESYMLLRETQDIIFEKNLSLCWLIGVGAVMRRS